MIRVRSFFWLVASIVLMTAVFRGGAASAKPLVRVNMRSLVQTRIGGSASESPADENNVEAESPPLYFYGTAAIPSGFRNTDISSRFITANSKILLTVDTTAVPGSDVALPGVMVRSKGNGYFTVSTLDRSIAPPSGIPFNYIVFNVPNIGGSVLGSAQIPKGVYNTGVNSGAATANSIILLTVDESSLATDVAVSGLKVNNHGAGFFSVTTLSLATAPNSGIPFTYLIVNGDFMAGTGKVPASVYNAGVNNTSIANPSGVFLTVDATTIPGSDVSLPGLKVNNHGGSFFTVTTDKLTSAPSTGVPYNYVVFQPPPQWEELGPTALSGNSWTVAVDPANRLIQYIGSQWGGVWKTVNGGNTWSSAWQGRPLIGITRLAISGSNRLFALARNGMVYWSDNAGSSWTQIPKAVPNLTETYFQGGQLGTNGPSAIYVCSDAGLYYWIIEPAPGSTDWQAAGPVGTHPCTDWVNGNGIGFFAAFRDIGVWADFGGGYIQVKTPVAPANRPIRIALGQGRIVLNYDCIVYVNAISSLNSPDSNGTWSNKGQHCATSQNGYDLAVAISPTDKNHFIITGNEADLTRDGGATWSGHLGVGQDDHQVTFWNDTFLYMSTDNGPRMSADGGSTWKQSEDNDYYTDGPPAKEYYDLSVSLADQFGRVYSGGNAQDSGAVAMIGRTAGFGTCGGENGLSTVAPRSLNIANPDGTRSSRFRVYATYEGDAKHLQVADITALGPDFRPPDPPSGEEGTLPVVNSCSIYATPTFPSDISAIAVSNAAIDTVLVGLDGGEVWRAVPGTSGKTFDRIVTVDPALPVTALYFASDNVAFVGYPSGVIVRITSPFAATVTNKFVTAPSPGQPVVAFASSYGDATTIYAATAGSIFLSQNSGDSWTDITGPSNANTLKANLAQGMEIVGLVRDLHHPYLYLAVGHSRFWDSTEAPNSAIWRCQAPLCGGAWSNFSQGLPLGLPVTNIGLSPDRALFIGTDGRAIWWRRDIASNVGISQLSPTNGTGPSDTPTTFVLTWTHPVRWRDLNTLDLRLHDLDDIPLWIRFTEGTTGTFSLLDAIGNVVSSGEAGSNLVLESDTAAFDLAKSGFQGTGPDGPSVTITFTVLFKAPLRDRTFNLELLATDDDGNSQGPDKAGAWTITPPTLRLPEIEK